MLPFLLSTQNETNLLNAPIYRYRWGLVWLTLYAAHVYLKYVLVSNALLTKIYQATLSRIDILSHNFFQKTIRFAYNA